MSSLRTAGFAGFSIVAFFLLWGVVDPAAGQTNGTGQGQNAAGIYIDSAGVVQPVLANGRSETLEKTRMAEAASRDLSADVNFPSDVRKVSLVRLQAELASISREGGTIPDDVFYLAGLQRIDFVFVYPESNDIVIAGPAEGFAPNSIGRTVGISTGRTPLRLDDMMLAFRAAWRKRPVGCSIDPTPKNLAALQKYIAANSDPVTVRVARSRYLAMADVLGMQNVRVHGVPGDSHFAQALVEADYRMKRIAMALEPSGVPGLQSHLSMLEPDGNSMQRWWLTPLYEAIITTADRNAFELVGQRVQMMAQEEIADSAGNRRSAATTRKTTRKYARLFTEKFSQLADSSPAFAELQNLFDLLVVASLIRKEGLAEKCGWSAEAFFGDSADSYPRGHAPKQVASVANSRRVNRGLVIGLVGGGVQIDASDTLDSVEWTAAPERRLDGRRVGAAPTGDLENKTWWWD